jgi:CarD family transcriptional regulator
MTTRNSKVRQTSPAKKLGATPLPRLRSAGIAGGKAHMARSERSAPTTFKIGDKAVYPAHGVGEVTAIENRDISGTQQTFYILRILDNGMKIMIPTTNVRQVGLREVIGKDKVAKVFEILRIKDLSVDTTTWNRRYREYMEKIKTGSVFEVAEVLRDLYLLKTDKDLSFCELKLLDTARGLLIKELAVAKNCDEEEVENEFKKIFQF